MKCYETRAIKIQISFPQMQRSCDQKTYRIQSNNLFYNNLIITIFQLNRILFIVIVTNSNKLDHFRYR